MYSTRFWYFIVALFDKSTTELDSKLHNNCHLSCQKPICEELSHTIYMYGIFTYMWLTFMVNVGKYTSPMEFPIESFHLWIPKFMGT